MSERRTGVVAGGCGLLLAVIGVGVVITWLAGNHDTPTPPEGHIPERAQAAAAPNPPPERDYGTEAFYIGQKACEKALKAPATAKFSSPSRDVDTGWIPYGFHQFQAFGHVDSQNSFGAMLRSQWLAVVRLSGDNYEVLYTRVGGVESGLMPGIAAAPPRQPSTQEIAASEAAIRSKKAEAAATALRYNQELAAKGDAYGQFRMGQRYLKGDGVERNLATAREMFQKAAAQGHSGAAEELTRLPAE